MPQATELEALLEKIVDDGMAVRRVMVPVHEVVFLKSVLEAYPGLAAVHAERGALHAPGSKAAKTPLVIATTAELAGELDEVLGELGVEPVIGSFA